MDVPAGGAYIVTATAIEVALIDPRGVRAPPSAASTSADTHAAAANADHARGAAPPRRSDVAAERQARAPSQPPAGA